MRTTLTSDGERRLAAAELELVAIKAMLESTHAELRASRAARDDLQVELCCARATLQNAREEVTELGRLVRSVVLGSRHRG